MRETRNAQSSIFDFYAEHEHGHQLKRLSSFLDQHPDFVYLIAQDFDKRDALNTGACGLSIESILRCLLLKQILGVSYRELAFYLCDSQTYRTFARLKARQTPKHSTLQATVPVSVVADGCYVSHANVDRARELGVKCTVFSKPASLGLHQMGVKKKTFQKLRNFRASIEGNISELKRAFGISKANWKGRDGFNAYVWSSVLSYNLIRWVRFDSG